MVNFFGLLFFLSIAAFIIGMFRPSIIIRYKLKPSRKNVLIVCAVVFILSFIGIGATAPKKSPQISASSTARNAKISTIDDKNIATIERDMKIDSAKASQNNSILHKVGLTTISSILGTPDTGYELSAQNLGGAVAVVYTDADKNIIKIVFKNQVLYDNDQVLENISEGLISESEKQQAYIAAKRAVKPRLKDPNSADFSNTFGAAKSNNIIHVLGIVRAKNSFGAVVPSKFSAEVRPVSYDVLSVNIEDMQ